MDTDGPAMETPKRNVTTDCAASINHCRNGRLGKTTVYRPGIGTHGGNKPEIRRISDQIPSTSLRHHCPQGRPKGQILSRHRSHSLATGSRSHVRHSDGCVRVPSGIGRIGDDRSGNRNTPSNPRRTIRPALIELAAVRSNLSGPNTAGGGQSDIPFSPAAGSSARSRRQLSSDYLLSRDAATGHMLGTARRGAFLRRSPASCP